MTLQERLVAQRLFQQLHQESDDEWYRANGNMLCPYCALPYWMHPLEERFNIDRRLCDGSVVHL